MICATLMDLLMALGVGLFVGALLGYTLCAFKQL
jgi:hypothetical protein